MIRLKLGAVVAAALFASTLAGAAHAQSTFDPRVSQTQAADRADADRRRVMDNGRVEQDLERRGSRRDRRDRVLTEAETLAAGQAAVTAAGLSCQVGSASLRGVTNDNVNMFEVSCGGGQGYIVTTATPPQTFDCLLLSAQAERIRAEGGVVPDGSTCSLPANQGDATSAIAGYAADAGIACTVDEGRVLGATPEGNMAYEVGCAGTDGFHIEQTAQGWKKADCLQLMSQNMECAFTTEAEQVAWFAPLLSANDGGECSVERIRLMAQNDSGRFIEAKCASGDGLVARVKDGAVDGVFTCAAASRVGGGCRMTEVDMDSED